MGSVARCFALAYAFPHPLSGYEFPMKRSLGLDLRHAPLAAAGAVVAAVGAATIAGALFFQYVVGLAPCPLCLDQRIPYYVAISLAVVLMYVAREGKHATLARLLLLAIVATLAYGAYLGVYHAGIEWGWWQGPPTCSAGTQPITGGGNMLERMRAARVVPCDEAQWRFLGLSLAGYNALIAGALALFALGVAMRGAK